MHHKGTVVTLRDLTKSKTNSRESKHSNFREFNHSKFEADGVPTSKAEVFLAFGTEWAIKFKFTDSIRRRLELWIDGSKVTDKLILANEALLERFQDSNKRFKFVEANNPAVADPTSTENGKVLIKLWKEVPAPSVFYAPGRIIPWRPDGDGWQIHPSWFGPTCADLSLGASASSTLLQVNCSATGATVEGSISSQVFDSTTWRGDLEGSCEIYIYQISGVESDLRAKYVGNKLQPNFCPHCGTKL